jgi:hypothetical protein
MSTPQPTTFDLNKVMIKLKKGDKTVDYLPVLWRLVWFREIYPQGTIDTELVHLDLDRHFEVEVTYWENNQRKTRIKKGDGYAMFKAVICTGDGGRATGHKKENAANFGDFEEKGETGSVGRALAALGFGTQFTDEEFFEGERLADSPVQKGKQNGQRPQQQRQRPAPAAKDDDPAVEAQISSIKKLYAKVGRESEKLEGLTYGKAKEIIQKLNAELKGQPKAEAPAPAKAQSNGHQVEPEPAQAPATDQQKASIEKLCDRLQKPVPEVQTFNQARELIRQLTSEVRTMLERKKQEVEAPNEKDEPVAQEPTVKMIEDKQFNTLLSLYGKLELEMPDVSKWSFDQAAVGIKELSKQLNEKLKAKAS